MTARLERERERKRLVFVEYTKLVVTTKKERTVETYLKKTGTLYNLFYGFDYFLLLLVTIYIYYL